MYKVNNLGFHLTSLRNRRDRYSTSKVLAEELRIRAENWEETREKQKLSHEQKQFRQLRRCPPGDGGGGTHYNGLYWEVPPKRGTLFRLQVGGRVQISLVEV